MINNDKLIDLLTEEKKVTSEELRYYSSFMYKFIPIVGSIILATFGYALKEDGKLIFMAVPLLINIFAVILLYINYNMILLDGFIRIIEKTLNKTIGVSIYKKNSDLLAIIYGGEKIPMPFLFILNVVIIIIIIMGIYIASIIYFINTQNGFLSDFWTWAFVVFCSLVPIIHITTYFTMTRRIFIEVNEIDKYYSKITLIENKKNE